MPGYILHLTAARMYLDHLPSSDPLSRDADRQNDFFAGNLLPDSVREKSRSHFRDPAYRDRMIEWPHPDRFLEKYRDLMDNAGCRGYWFHLYIDRRFFRDYIPRVAEFYDEGGAVTDLRDRTVYVLVKKSGEMIPLPRYLSEEYYYGDYTRLNTWLAERYHLPDELETPDNPGIEEVDYRGLSRVLEELRGYRKVPAEAAEYLKVFDREDLLRFLEAASIEAVSIRGGVSGDGAPGMSRRIQSADEIPGQKKAAMSERP